MDEKHLPPMNRIWTVRLLVLAAVVGLPVLLYLMLPEVSRKRSSKRRVTCKSNLRQIALACQVYADDNDGWFPTDIEQLDLAFADDRNVFKCPSAAPDDGSVSYVLVPGLSEKMPAEFMLAYDKAENHQGAGCNVAFVDGHVEWRRAKGDFRKTLAAQRAAVAAWRKSGKPVESLEEVYAKILTGKSKE